MTLSEFYYKGAYHSIQVVSSADELPASAQPIGNINSKRYRYNLYEASKGLYAIQK